MKNTKKFLSLLLVLCMALGLLAGCGGGSGSGSNKTISCDGPKYGGHLNVHTMYNTNNIDYTQSTGVWGYVWASCVYENVLTRDADYNIAPGACNYELSEDGLTLKLWVRDGLTFHNGDKVDIYDIEASLTRFFKMYSSAKLFVTPYVKNMVVEGDTLTLTFTENREKIMYYLANGRTWCAVIPKETCEKYPNGIFTAVEDAVGTGPYKITNFVAGVRIDVEKFDGYVPCEEGRTGMAAPKMGYLDSISFHYNGNYSSSTLAMLSGEYDVSDVIEEDYLTMAEEKGLKKYNLGDTVTGLYAIFNTFGTNNQCAKYPSLRKAIMAAIDFEQFVNIYSDGGTTVGGSPIVLDKYDTDILQKADYYGATNMDAVEKYLEAAKAEGYDGDPIQLIATTNPQEVEMLALLGSYLDAAGINYDKQTMESVAYSKYISAADNNWDFIITYPLLGFTPGTLHDMISRHYWKSAEKDAVIEKLALAERDSEEYMNAWYELAQLMVDECPNVHLGTTQWIWYHSEYLHTNDDGEQRFFYNAYWDNPEDHPKK